MASTYAQIKSGIVQNIILIDDGTDVTGFLEGYDALVKIDGLDPSIAIGWTYDGEVFAAPLPPAIDLPTAKYRKIVAFGMALQAFSQAKYPQTIQISFLALYEIAKKAGRTNQQTYIEQLLTWANSILTYNVTFVGQVGACASLQAVADLAWDIEGNVLADPQVTLLAAAAIPN